ncbi:hypothetical protein HanIR_Chr09g0443371 [Helianthus annuus]|nr:hypothetical protein HanIR_Chr09g0443371 [Helianthus annuus]
MEKQYKSLKEFGVGDFVLVRLVRDKNIKELNSLLSNCSIVCQEGKRVQAIKKAHKSSAAYTVLIWI